MCHVSSACGTLLPTYHLLPTCCCQVVQIFWNGLMTEVMMTAFLMSAEPDDGTPLSPILLTSSTPIPTLPLTLTLTLTLT